MNTNIKRANGESISPVRPECKSINGFEVASTRPDNKETCLLKTVLAKIIARNMVSNAARADGNLKEKLLKPNVLKDKDISHKPKGGFKFQ